MHPTNGLRRSATQMHPGDKAWEDWLADQLLHFMQRGGCSFQKFGQWMSMRPDMFSQLLVNKMSELRQDSPAHSAAVTRQIFRETFGVAVEEIFEEFSDKPIASGSIAQVSPHTPPTPGSLHLECAGD